MSLFNPQPGAGNPLGLANPAFKLEYPQSIGVFTSYADAQKAVDSLADQDFPVANIAIVGTDLKLIERVTGRKTWGTVINAGLLNGLSTALMIALILILLEPGRDFLGLILEAMLIGVIIGVGFSVLGHRLSRGQRDFTSITQTVPSKFEILCEHKVAAQARELLSKTPDARGAAFDPARAQQPYGQPPYAPGQPPFGTPQPPIAPGQPPYGTSQPPFGTQGAWPQAGPPYGQSPYGQPPYGQVPPATPPVVGYPGPVGAPPGPQDGPVAPTASGGRDTFDPQRPADPAGADQPGTPTPTSPADPGPRP